MVQKKLRRFKFLLLIIIIFPVNFCEKIALVASIEIWSHDIRLSSMLTVHHHAYLTDEISNTKSPAQIQFNQPKGLIPNVRLY